MDIFSVLGLVVLLTILAISNQRRALPTIDAIKVADDTRFFVLPLPHF